MFWMVNNEFNEFYFILIFIVFVELYVYDNIVWLIVLYNNVYMVKILMREKKINWKELIYFWLFYVYFILLWERDWKSDYLFVKWVK